MSKNIKLNETQYNGISMINVPTTSGGTASFKDVDEITTPSGTKTITANGTYDVTEFATATVNVPTGGGSGSMETGTIVGDDTNTLEILVSSKKTHIVLWANIADAIATSTAFVNTEVNAIKGMGMYYSMTNVGGTAMLGYAVEEKDYTTSHAQSKNVTCTFSDGKITIVSSSYNNKQKFLSGLTYNWVAW